jgi:ATP-dependent Clp protease ATP-binding subunit ClpC
MKAVMQEIEKNPDVILFIDEIHTIIGAGGASGSLDASNMFKPALARGEMQAIGATTLDEYRQYIEKDGALERRFQKVLVEPTTVEETIQILNNIKERYEEHHMVSFTPEAIEACVKLTDRYISDRHLPDKAIDALDEVGSRVHITNINVPKEIIDIEKN